MQARKRTEIDAAANDFFQSLFQIDKLEDAYRILETYYQINITLCPVLTTRDRPENAKTFYPSLNAQRAKFLLQPCKFHTSTL